MFYSRSWQKSKNPLLPCYGCPRCPLMITVCMTVLIRKIQHFDLISFIENDRLCASSLVWPGRFAEHLRGRPDFQRVVSVGWNIIPQSSESDTRTHFECICRSRVAGRTKFLTWQELPRLERPGPHQIATRSTSEKYCTPQVPKCLNDPRKIYCPKHSFVVVGIIDC